MDWPRISFPRFGGLFKAPPARLRGEDDWQAGDLAECIRRGPWFLFGAIPSDTGPQPKERYVVDEVIPSGPCVGSSRWSLCFRRFPGHAFTAAAFRKVTPRADEAIAGSAATIDQLKSVPAQPEPVR